MNAVRKASRRPPPHIDNSGYSPGNLFKSTRFCQEHGVARSNLENFVGDVVDRE
jgi:hypothetical protein